MLHAATSAVKPQNVLPTHTPATRAAAVRDVEGPKSNAAFAKTVDAFAMRAPGSLVGLENLVAERVDSVNGHATGEELRALMIHDLKDVARIFREHYAPAEWKTQTRGWDLEADLRKAIAAVMAMDEPSRPAYHRVLKTFLAGVSDYHVGIVFDSTEQATLPFTTNIAEGRVFVMAVDRFNAPELPLQPGDEILSFNGQPAGQAVAELTKQISTNTPGTDLELAALSLTNRRAARGMSVPKGDVVVQVRSKETGEVTERTLTWEYTPNHLAWPNQGRGLKPSGKAPNWSSYGEMSASFWATDGDKKAENPYALGARKSFIPALGEVTWEAKDSSKLYGYIFENDEGKKIGYIRIPHYSAGIPEMLSFVKLLLKMRKTEGLVIDQVNNPGGSVAYLYQLVSMLMDKPAYPPKHRMSITSEDVARSYELLEKPDEEFQGLPADIIEALRDNAAFIIKEWRAGRTLTRPYHLGLGNFINPAPANYGGKIMVIVNNLDFSGGDFFPAILQDNERALIFGERTAGAGGYVKMVNRAPNELGVKGFTYTASVAERIDGSKLESDGVTPDVKYEMTADDLQNGFQGYKKAILDTLTKLLSGDEAE